jgi:hypothetical protein
MEATIVHQMSLEPPHAVPSAKIIELRTQVERVVAAIHGFADVVKYEFEPDRTGDMKISQEIVNVVSTSTNLLLSLQAVPGRVDTVYGGKALRMFHESLERGLQYLACSLEQVPGRGAEPEQRLARSLDVPWVVVPKFIGKAIDSYRELQMLCESIVVPTLQRRAECRSNPDHGN